MIFKFLHIPVLFGLSIGVYIICLIVAITTFYFCIWLLKNFVKAERTRKLTALTIAVVATPLIYLGLIRLLLFWITYTPSKGFDKSEWLTEKQERFQMADDIIKTKMLISKDTNQVKQILGDPTWNGDTAQVWSYDMGMGGGGLGFMFNNLIIKFDNNKVVAVQHSKIRD